MEPLAPARNSVDLYLDPKGPLGEAMNAQLNATLNTMQTTRDTMQTTSILQRRGSAESLGSAATMGAPGEFPSEIWG